MDTTAAYCRTYLHLATTTVRPGKDQPQHLVLEAVRTYVLQKRSNLRFEVRVQP